MAFTNTRRILAKLEDLLKCGVCLNLLSAPCTLGHCEHLFCRSCADKFLGSSCPTCGATASRIDPRPNEQLLAAVDICQRLSSLLMPRPVAENQLNESTAVSGNPPVDNVNIGSQPTENQPSETQQIKPSVLNCHLYENQPTGTLQNEPAVTSKSLPTDSQCVEIITVKSQPTENQPSGIQQSESSSIPSSLDHNQPIANVTVDNQLSDSHLSGSQAVKEFISGSQFNKTMTVDCSRTKESVATVPFKEPLTESAMVNNRQRFVKQLINDSRLVESDNVGIWSERNHDKELMWSQVSGIQPLDHESDVDWSADVTLTTAAAAETSSSQIPAANNIVNKSHNTTPRPVSPSSDLEDEIPDTPPHGNSSHVIDLNRSYNSQVVRMTSTSKLPTCRSVKTRSLGVRRHIVTPLKTSVTRNCTTRLCDKSNDGNRIGCSASQLPQSQNAAMALDSETIDPTPTVQVVSDSNPEIIGSAVKSLPYTDQSPKSNVNEESGLSTNVRILKPPFPEFTSVFPVEVGVTATQQRCASECSTDKILLKSNNNNNDQLCVMSGENSVNLLHSVGFVRSDCSESRILHHKSSSESSEDEVDGTDFRQKELGIYGTVIHPVGGRSSRIPRSGKAKGRETRKLEEKLSVVQDGTKMLQRKVAEDVVVLEDTDDLCEDDGVQDGAKDKLDVSLDAVELDMEKCDEPLQKTDPAEDLISISDGTEELWEDDDKVGEEKVGEKAEDKKVLDGDDESETVADEDLWKNVVNLLEGKDDVKVTEPRNGNRNEDKVLTNPGKDEDVASDVTEEISLDDEEATQELDEVDGDVQKEELCVTVAEKVVQKSVECAVEDLDEDLIRGTKDTVKARDVVSDDTEELWPDDVVVQEKDSEQHVEQERRDAEEEATEFPDDKEDAEKVVMEKCVGVMPEAGEELPDDVLEKEAVEEGREKLVENVAEKMEDEKDIEENILATCSSFAVQHPVHTYGRHHLPGKKSVVTEKKNDGKNDRSQMLRVAPARRWEDVGVIDAPKQKLVQLRTGKGGTCRSRVSSSGDSETDVPTVTPAKSVAISRQSRLAENEMERVTSRVLDLFEEPRIQNEEELGGKDIGRMAVLDDILDICEASSVLPPQKKLKTTEPKATRRRSDKNWKPELSKQERNVKKLSAEQKSTLEATISVTDNIRRRSSSKKVVAEKSPETILDALGISDDKIETETKLSDVGNVESGAKSNAPKTRRSGENKNTRSALIRSGKRKSEEISGNEEVTSNRKRIEVQPECNPSESAENKSSPESNFATHGISEVGTPLAATKSTPSSVRSAASMVTTSTSSSGKRSVGRKLQRKDLTSGENEKSEMEFTTPTMPSRRKRSVVETPGSGGTTPVEHSRSRKLSPSPARLFASSPSLKRNAKGETLLHLAAIKGDVEWVQTLLEAGFNPNVKDYANWTPLHEACNRGNVAIATLLLDYRALIDVPGGDNETSLHDAVTNGRVECVRLLVSRGASINARDRHGKTPVDLAWTDEMKVALRVPVNTQRHKEPLNPVARVELEEDLPVVMTTGLNKDERSLVQDCCGKLGWTLVENFTSEVTHLVSSVNRDGSCRRTIKFLESILAGLWIVDVKWIKECDRLKTRVCELEFEASGNTLSPCTMAPLKARQNKDKQLPGLFDGCRFYFHGEFRPPTPPREDLVRLVRLGGGVILTREPRLEVIEQSEFIVPYHSDRDCALADCSHYIVSSSVDCVQLVDGRQLARVPPSWIMTCIAAFRLVDQL